MPRKAWNKRLTPEIENLIVAQYQSGQSASKILQTIPFKTRKTVYDVLAKHAIQRRSPRGLADYKKLHEAIFANLDTPVKAYWIGMLLSDGYVIDTRKNCEPQIGLQLIDRHIMESFRDFLGAENQILEIAPRSVRHRPMYRVVVHSRRMAEDLMRYGVIPRKSHSTFLPILPPELMPHLLRGIYDGDGTISHRADGGVILGYCGSERLVLEIRMWLICALGVSPNEVHRNGSIAFVQWSHLDDVRRIGRYLYQDAESFWKGNLLLSRSPYET
jgi:hypothetical protein